jgi:N-acetylmuramoyl-L-alanine amidase
MNIIQMPLTPGRERGRGMTPLLAEGVLIHYVGNPGSSALNNRNYFENGSGGNRVSAHYIVGLSGEIIQCVPEDERAAHAGKSLSPAFDAMAKTNNARFIGVEVCHPDASGRFLAVTYRALVGLCADICVRRGFDVYTQLLRHYDVTGKTCPLYYVRNQGEWNKLRNAVYAGTLAQKCLQLERPVDMPYWERVMSGEILADPEYVRILEERVDELEPRT